MDDIYLRLTIVRFGVVIGQCPVILPHELKRIISFQRASQNLKNKNRELTNAIKKLVWLP